MSLSLERRRWLWAYAFMAAPVLFFLVIRIAPTLYAFNVSLHNWDPIAERQPFVGTKNFERLWTDKLFWRALRNTVSYVVFSVPIGLTLSLLVALGLQRLTRFVGFYRLLYFIPYITSLVAVSWVWRWMYTPNGIFNNILSAIGVGRQGFLSSTTQSLPAIVAMTVWQGLGFQIVIFLAGLEGIPDVYYEAAELDGATEWQRFRFVTVPLLNPTIVFLAVVGVISSLQVFTQIRNMSPQGQGGPLDSTLSLVLYVYRLAFDSLPSKMGYGSAITVVLFLLILLVTLIQLKVLTRRYEY